MVRADASSSIGLGHLRRCLSLAAALREAGADVRFVSRNLGVDIAAFAAAAGLEYRALMSADWQSDAEETGGAAAEWAAHWVVVDHYELDARWHRLVAQRAGVRLAVIDDLADRDIAAQVLIDHNPSVDHRAKYRGRIAPSTRVLGGPRYALLDPTYARVAPFKVAPQVRSIGIFMGGTDPTDISSVALRACRIHAGFSGLIEVATTSANPHLPALRRSARQWPQTTITLDQPLLLDFFGRHDLQLGAGGGAVWERCRVGVPSFCLLAADNQYATLPVLAGLGAVAVLPDLTSRDEQEIGRAVRLLADDVAARVRLSERSRSLVDGNGARRCALSLTADTLAVRPAALHDARTMFAWRNDPASRAVSHDTSELNWNDHLRWVAAVLADPQRCLLIGRVGAIDVGVIRFDLRADQTAEVSLYLDPELHGLGLGHSLLLAGEARCRELTPALRGFEATVRAGNDSSQRMFAGCGYSFREGMWHKAAGTIRLQEI
jgi:UDP-2,4-diacetamido-2,4,6-trideoxy-beta-L-altropyranose hydrolase